jgi:hypothetical protein
MTLNDDLLSINRRRDHVCGGDGGESKAIVPYSPEPGKRTPDITRFFKGINILYRYLTTNEPLF